MNELPVFQPSDNKPVEIFKLAANAPALTVEPTLMAVSEVKQLAGAPGA